MRLATTLFVATAVVALAGCNQTAGNNAAATNTTATNAAAPAPAPAPAEANGMMPADANAMEGGNSSKPSDQPAGDEMMEEEGAAEVNQR